MTGKAAFRVFDIAIVLVLLASGVLWYFSVMRQLSDEGTSSTAQEPPAEVADSEQAEEPPRAEPMAPQIELARRTLQGRSFETIRIDGRYRVTTDDGVSLRVQRLERGAWVSFPLPVVTDPRGRFTAYVELGRTGSYRLRVLEPKTGHTSRVARLQIV